MSVRSITRAFAVGLVVLAILYGGRSALAGDGQIVDEAPTGKFVQGRIQPKILRKAPAIEADFPLLALDDE